MSRRDSRAASVERAGFSGGLCDEVGQVSEGSPPQARSCRWHDVGRWSCRSFNKEIAVVSIRHEVTVARSAADVWDVLRDVGSVHRRLLPARVQDVSVDGDVRTLTMPDGHVVQELIVAVDEDARRLAYAVIEGSRPPLRHHHASFQVFAEGTRRSRLVWITDILPSSHADLVQVRTKRGLEEMKQTLENHGGARPTSR